MSITVDRPTIGLIPNYGAVSKDWLVEDRLEFPIGTQRVHCSCGAVMVAHTSGWTCPECGVIVMVGWIVGKVLS